MNYETVAKLAKRHSRGTRIAGILFIAAVIAVAVGVGSTMKYMIWVGLGLLAATIGFAAVFVDPTEKKFRDAYEEKYLFPVCKKYFGGSFRFDRQGGFDKADVKGMGLVQLGRFTTLNMLSGKYGGRAFKSAYLVIKQRHSKTAGKKADVKVINDAQVMRFEDSSLNAPDVMIRPKGAFDTEGLMLKMKRPYKLAENIGTEAFQRRFEVLAQSYDGLAEFFDEERCAALLDYRSMVRATSRYSSVFVHYNGNAADVIINNWANKTMPSTSLPFTDSQYRRFAEDVTDIIRGFVDMGRRPLCDRAEDEAAVEADYIETAKK